MMAYSWIDVVSIALNLIFGGGFIITLLTLRAQRKKAGAEAKGAEATAESTELDNVEKAIKIWREMAENLKTQRDEAIASFSEVSKQVEALRRDVKKLNCTNQKILKLLDQISHENLERMVKEIKDEIEKSDA
jgi:predicted RNase H-like nuclease (RuvC/YqgF family)